MVGTQSPNSAARPGETTGGTVAKRCPCLVVFGEDGAEALPLTEKTTKIGRGPRCDLRIPDRRISALHAIIRRTPEGYVLRDLDSTNGTTVNGVPVESARLCPGDRIELAGALELFFADRLMAPRLHRPKRGSDLRDTHEEVEETESRFGRPQDRDSAV